MPITSDQLTSYLRTLVPAIWGWLITLLLSHFGWLQEAFDAVGFDPHSTVTTGAVTSLFFFLWYALWRHLEMRGILPDAVRRIVLGAAAAPQYNGRGGRHLAPADGEPRNEVGLADNSSLVTVVLVLIALVLIIWIVRQ